MFGGKSVEVEPKFRTVKDKGNCPQCFAGICRAHPFRDHGQRSDALKAQSKSSTLDKMYAKLVGPQIEKLRSAQAVDADAEKAFQKSIKRDRERQQKRSDRSPPKLNAEQLRLASTGLDGKVVRLMTAVDDSGSDDSDDSSKKRRQKADKKAKKKEKKADEKKEKKEKKREKKRRKKEAKASTSDSDSDSD
ncbi:hypothetical protein M885DRAFT_511530 [Pelagophyceae sp. CCMP2097]|nr:hypothetical protein M885DRAFT_511530 [Pelagophyceae sp. CCMP2097]